MARRPYKPLTISFMRKILFSLILIFSCSLVLAQKEEAQKYLTHSNAIKHAFVGISIYDTKTDKTIYEHNGTRYFTPASNTKLFSLYTGLRYLKDFTTGLQFQISTDTLYIRGTGDPTFLHPDFDYQPIYNFLRGSKFPISLVKTRTKNKIFGPGWAWDDYNGSYQPERSSFPIYGNVIRYRLKKGILKATPSHFASEHYTAKKTGASPQKSGIKRKRTKNKFFYDIRKINKGFKQESPFITSNSLTRALLQDTLQKKVYQSDRPLPRGNWRTVENAPLDSLFKHMMHHSDNFYAEQTQAMVSMKLFDRIDTKKVIKHVLKSDLKNLPQKPNWVDGSGLSRYNLFTPADMVDVLRHLYEEFPKARIFNILPTGGEGTLTNYYRDMEDKLYAKTGTLYGSVALSGYLFPRNRDSPLIFSVIINNMSEPAYKGRQATEKFLKALYRNY